jgi:hypothetical protein
MWKMETTMTLYAAKHDDFRIIDELQIDFGDWVDPSIFLPELFLLLPGFSF